jgi:pyruvate/2-oxoglutarate dehydrogenase complex dihydrolipoamide dehydrogenase (E3) component
MYSWPRAVPAGSAVTGNHRPAATRVQSVEGKSGREVRVRTTGPAGEGVITGTDLLVAAGRTPNTAGIGLELAGVERTEAGYLKVDEHLATTADRV